MSARPLLALTMGDPAGIGPEICLRALGNAEISKVCCLVLFGDAGVLRRVASQTNQELSAETVSLRDIEKREFKCERPVVVECSRLSETEVQPGKLSVAGGRASFDYVESAIRAASQGRVSAVVTAPIQKEAWRLAGVNCPGHTELFTILTGASRSCMMQTSEALTVTMVTTHVGYTEVPRLLTVERVLDVIELTAQAMLDMKQRSPKLGVCGLNPHAGEHGLFGQGEEERIIAPAIERARSKGIDIDGPLPPDAAFLTHVREQFDAIVCMYHDQGHIPFKMLAFHTGVNVTLGLPIIRTSVDHGTAYNIAWKGIANPSSLFSAINVALKIAAGRGASAIHHAGLRQS